MSIIIHPKHFKMRLILLSSLLALIFASTGSSQTNLSEGSANLLKYDMKSSRIDSMLEAYAYYGRFSGTVLVAHNESTVFCKSYGYADFETKKRNNENSMYGLGSFTKTFTGTAILKLVQEGKISLENTVYDFFPELGEAMNQVTIHHLLSMSAGINEDFARSKSYDVESIVFPEAQPISTRDLVHYFGELSLYDTPGKTFDYSNINYVLLAAIVEQVSGLSYHDFLKNTFFDVLNMNTSAFGSHNAADSKLSKAYTGLPAAYTEAEFWHDSWMLGAGGAFASAADVHKWMRAVNSGRVLDVIHTQMLFKKHKKAGKDYYGYGWQTGMRKGHKYIFHDGGTLGYVCEAGFFPDDGLYIVVLTNHTHKLGDIGKSVILNREINNQIHNILFDKPDTKLPVPLIDTAIDFPNKLSIAGFDYTAEQKDGKINFTASDNSPSILDVPFRQNLSEDSRRFKKAQKLAEAFGREDFKYIRRQGGLTMRLMISKEKLQQMWTDLTGEKGAFLAYNFYRIPDTKHSDHYWVRLKHSEKEIGLLLILDRRGKVEGMHIDQRFSSGAPGNLTAQVIDENRIFIDGFRFGYYDAQIIKENGEWILRCLGRDFAINAD
jgi:CubicO group peptidase (beta-lactamase class C family)